MKTFNKIIAAKLNGVAKSTKHRQANVQEIIGLTFNHAADNGDYSALTRLVSVVGNHEKQQIVRYVLAHTVNLKYNSKKACFTKTSKKASLSFNCEGITKISWHVWCKENKNDILDLDKLAQIQKWVDAINKKVENATEIKGDIEAFNARIKKLETIL